MKEIKYQGNLEGSINDSKTTYNLSEKLVNAFNITALLQLVVLFLVAVFATPTLVLSNILAIEGVFWNLSFIINSLIITQRSKHFTKKKNNAYKNLNEVVDELHKNDVVITRDKLQECLISSNNPEKKSENEETNYYHFYDLKGKLVVLKELRKYLIEQKNKIESEQLFLLDNEDIRADQENIIKKFNLR